MLQFVTHKWCVETTFIKEKSLSTFYAEQNNTQWSDHYITLLEFKQIKSYP